MLNFINQCVSLKYILSDCDALKKRHMAMDHKRKCTIPRTLPQRGKTGEATTTAATAPPPTATTTLETTTAIIQF